MSKKPKKNKLNTSFYKHTHSLALHVATDVAGGVIGGVLIGYGVDSFFSTKPWGIIIFFVLGSIAGLLNVFRTLKSFGYGVKFKQDVKNKRNPRG